MLNWVINVFSSVLIITVISLLLPEGRLAKFIKPFISLILILIILSPINNIGILFDGISESNFYLETDSEFLLKTAQAKIDVKTANCILIAEKNGITKAEILIQYTVDESFTPNIYGVKINLQKAVITSENEHIVILQRLKEDICAYLVLSEKGVEIYE